MDVISDVPAGIEWRIYKGDTAKLTIYVTDSDDQPIDLSTYAVTGQIRQSPQDATIIASLAIGVNVNQIDLEISDTSILPKTAFFDIQTVSSSDEVRTIMQGKLVSSQDVTRNG